MYWISTAHVTALSFMCAFLAFQCHFVFQPKDLLKCQINPTADHIVCFEFDFDWSFSVLNNNGYTQVCVSQEAKYNCWGERWILRSRFVWRVNNECFWSGEKESGQQLLSGFSQSENPFYKCVPMFYSLHGKRGVIWKPHMHELEARTKNNVSCVASIPIAIPMAMGVLTSHQTNCKKAVAAVNSFFHSELACYRFMYKNIQIAERNFISLMLQCP